VGKNDGPVLSRLWVKVHEVSKGYREPIVVSDILARLFIFYLFIYLQKACYAV